jgi:hypothetical protein
MTESPLPIINVDPGNAGRAARAGADRRPTTLSRIVALAIGVWAVVFVALVIIWIIRPGSDSLLYELAKALMEVLVVVAIGAVISLAIDRYQDGQTKAAGAEATARDTRHRRDELVRATVTDAIDNYHRVKRARRLLRAQIYAGSDGDLVSLAPYDEHLAAINDAQLNFERLKRMVPLLTVPGAAVSSLESNLRTVEQSLGELCKEYEGKRRIVAHAGEATLDDLPKLRAFLARRREGDSGIIADPLDNGFGAIADPLGDILRELRGELLEPFKFPRAEPPPPAGRRLRRWPRPRAAGRD